MGSCSNGCKSICTSVDGDGADVVDGDDDDENDDDEFVHSLDRKSFGVLRPPLLLSVESGLGQVNCD